jgi:hypothetical protein
MLYVTARPDAFKRWRRFAIQRLAKVYPANAQDPLGPPLPREVLDADTKYDPTQAPALIDAHLRSMDPSRNPFLASAADMVDAGYTGTPYTYP